MRECQERRPQTKKPKRHTGTAVQWDGHEPLGLGAAIGSHRRPGRLGPPLPLRLGYMQINDGWDDNAADGLM
ncbi:hypothetical protein [Streptomyces sp. NPDC018031]|uniref:hypothetical protein n=1 Tax=Streptomyces sp. NPDC018031 TaxID=3365033 RepID=UPI00378E8E9C